MAWEWIGTSVVGVAGIWGTWLTGKQARDDARATAREAREQQRLGNAYVELLETSEQAGQWAQTVLPMRDSIPPQPVPDLPSIEVQAHTEALVKAFGSAEVRELMEVWRSIVKEAIAIVGLILWVEEDVERHRGIPQSPRIKLDELRRQEREARKALGDQVAIELGQRRKANPRAVAVPAPPWY
jgi:hypothetical protein